MCTFISEFHIVKQKTIDAISFTDREATNILIIVNAN